MAEVRQDALERMKKAMEVVYGLSLRTLEAYARLWELEIWDQRRERDA